MKCMGLPPRPSAFKPLVSESISFTSFLNKRPNWGTLLREDVRSVSQYFGFGHDPSPDSTKVSSANSPSIVEEPLERSTREGPSKTNLNNENIDSLEHIRDTPNSGGSPNTGLSSLESVQAFGLPDLPSSAPAEERLVNWIYSQASESIYLPFRLTPMPLFSARSLECYRRQYRLEQTRSQNVDEIQVQDIHPGYQTFNAFDALPNEENSSSTLVSPELGSIVPPSLVREFELRKFKSKTPKYLKLRLRTTRSRRQRSYKSIK